VVSIDVAPIDVAPMGVADWPQVRAIYAAGIETGNATFESNAPQWDAWDKTHLAEHRLVAREAGRIVGWAAVAPVSGRQVYAGVVEHSVYVDPGVAGRGVGAVLLRALIASTEAAGIWTLAAGIFPENAASLAVHERLGFRRVGVRERLGRHRGVWRDVVLVERRSAVVGGAGVDQGLDAST
jgi:L-amino acid N-acyltransferase YncA